MMWLPFMNHWLLNYCEINDIELFEKLLNAKHARWELDTND